jgi:hypothetical protein
MSNDVFRKIPQQARNFCSRVVVLDMKDGSFEDLLVQPRRSEVPALPGSLPSDVNMFWALKLPIVNGRASPHSVVALVE